MIYCCYPGTGKSYALKHRDDIGEYRYDYPTEDQKRDLDAYIDERGKEIEELSKKYQHLFLQTDFNLFEAMDRKNIPYTIIIPDYRILGMKEVMQERYITRGTKSLNFLREMITNWDKNMAAFEENKAPKIYLKENQFVLDVI